MSKQILQCPPSTSAGNRAITDWWRQAHEQMLKLCEELETIADSLPANVNRQKCLYAAKALGTLIKEIHDYENDVLFPSLEAGIADDGLRKTLARLRQEHFEDACFAEELQERLMALGMARPDVNMEATGYMLRGFFEAVRRHVAFEREHLLAWLGGKGSPVAA